MTNLNHKKKSGIGAGADSESGHDRVDRGRRLFAKAGLAAFPLVITLSSRPVWAGCISNMLSYNPSGHQEADTECEPTGFSPLYWRDNPEAWPAGVDYGKCDKPNGCKSCGDYKGGTKVAEILPGGREQPVVKILCTRPDSYLAYCCTAYLNCVALEGQYSLSYEQVMGLWEGTILPEMSRGEIKALLAQTWS